ncbi:hypothetical protein [Sphingomonas sp. SUN039]|uniref:hypothetical protein n=1 Tax=Sphingomonas sp. SUN039 TaxID=2937787 RepID=UPI0021646605|nr:hypothetical protein [Sphingomonas sp. SUN039]UVO52604.1 hypothetical protein M0209_00135 [Sphingomonas sp. SUN039]
MSARFAHFAAVDWSGAVGPRQSGIAVAICGAGSGAPVLVRPGHVWSRQDVLDWLLNELPADTLVGLDLSTSFAFADCGAFFPSWADSPADARALWALVEDICADDPHLAASSFVDHPEASRHFRRHGNRTGDRFGIGRGRLRVTEQGQREQGLSPYSNFNLVGAAQVGKSSLTGMRMLHRLDGYLPLWPVDPRPESGPVVVEIYTTLAARAAGIAKGRSKIRDAATLDTALAALGSEPHAPLPRYTDHATDALIAAAWLRTVADEAGLWQPQGLDAVRHTEGWTFGIR